MYLLGTAIGYEVAWRKGTTAGVASSLVALYSLIFFYHRFYDAVVLALPLVYSTGRARSERGWIRWLFAASAVAILAVLNLRLGALRYVANNAQDWGSCGRLLQIFILPYGTWFILIALVCIWRASRLTRVPRLPDQGTVRCQ